MAETYYTVLGVPSNATSKQIRDRFLQLARDRHPDRFAAEGKEDAELEFQKITQAYNVLHDLNRRRQYDQDLAVRFKSAEAEIGEQAARVYLRRGVEAFKKKRYREAVDNLEQATRENPDDAQAWFYLARVSSRRTSWLSRGLAAVTKACELDSSNPEYLKLAGALSAQAGMTTRALKYYLDALTFGGEDAQVRREVERLKKAAS